MEFEQMTFNFEGKIKYAPCPLREECGAYKLEDAEEGYPRGCTGKLLLCGKYEEYQERLKNGC